MPLAIENLPPDRSPPRHRNSWAVRCSPSDPLELRAARHRGRAPLSHQTPSGRAPLAIFYGNCGPTGSLYIPIPTLPKPTIPISPTRSLSRRQFALFPLSSSASSQTLHLQYSAMAGREAMNPAAQLGDPEDGQMAAQLPEVLFMAAHRDEPEDDDAEALRHYAFLFMLLVASSLIYVVGNPCSSFAAEDVLTLFLFWNIFLVVFLVSFVPRLHPVVARIAALIAHALRTYLFARSGSSLLELLSVAAVLPSSAYAERGLALLLFLCWALGLTLWLASLEPRALASAASAAARIAASAAAALPDYFLGGRDLVRIAAIPWPAVVVILASPLLICTVGELGTDNAIVLFVVWILSMGVLFGLATPTRIARFVAAALRN